MRNELVIGGYSIDTIEDLDINITKEVYNIDDPSKRQSDFSKSVDIPGSKANDFVFKSLFDVSFSIRNSDQLNPDFNPSKKATCIYYQDTLQQISGYCQLNEIKILKNQVERMEEKLDSIMQKLDTNIIKNCDKMGEHIDFVNNVYDTVKVPLHYISNKVQKMIGGAANPTVFEYNASKNVIVNDTENSNDDEYLFTEND